MKKTKIQTKMLMIDQLTKCKETIAKERDNIREILSEYEEIANKANEACESLREAIDILSEQL